MSCSMISLNLWLHQAYAPSVLHVKKLIAHLIFNLSTSITRLIFIEVRMWPTMPLGCYEPPNTLTSKAYLPVVLLVCPGSI